MILYIVFSYIFMLGFLGFATKANRVKPHHSGLGFIFSPLSMPLFLGIAIAVIADK